MINFLRVLYKLLIVGMVLIGLPIVTEYFFPKTICNAVGIPPELRGLAILWSVASFTLLCAWAIAIEPWGFHKNRSIGDPSVIEAVLFFFGSTLGILATADLAAFMLRMEPTWFAYSQAISGKQSSAITILMVEMATAAVSSWMSISHFRRRLNTGVPTNTAY